MIDKMGYEVRFIYISSITLRQYHLTLDNFLAVLTVTFRILALQVKLVRVTKRVHEAYYAQLYLTKVYSLHLCASADHPFFFFLCFEKDPSMS